MVIDTLYRGSRPTAALAVDACVRFPPIGFLLKMEMVFAQDDNAFRKQRDLFGAHIDPQA